VKEVTDMTSMFDNAWNFNSDLSKWNVSKVKYMSYMFVRAQTFNSNISGWYVRNVIQAVSMFAYAYAFNQNLCNWKLQCSAAVDDMFDNSGCPRIDDPTCSNSATFCQECE
jgi:surface protein